MPEGPEIRLAADKVAKSVAGRPLRKVFFSFPHLKRYQRRLAGATVTRIDTRGKAMLTRFDNGLTLYSHNQLYGRWYVTKGSPPDTNRSLRVALHTERGSAFLYSASEIEILTEDKLAEHKFLGRLGPDILATTPAEVEKVLRHRRFAGRALGGLYLDQSFLAGLGNYLRSEILHFARLHHKRKPKDLDARELRCLAKVTCTISNRSYRTGGVTNPDSLTRRLRRAGKTYGAYRFAVFGRDSLPCYRCGDPIERTTVSSRRLYFCSRCQRV